VLVSSADSLATSEIDELEEWLKIRLDADAVEVQQRPR
jgi:acyl carrier protein